MIFRPDMLLFGDAVGTIITLIIIVISIVASLMQQMAEAKKKRGPAGKRPPRGQPAAADDLQREIDAFLKAGGRKAEDPRGRRAPQPVVNEPVEPVVVAEPVEQSLADHVRQTMGELGEKGAPVAPAATSDRGRRASGDRAEQRRPGRLSRSGTSQRAAPGTADARASSVGPIAPTAATASRVVQASEFPLSAALIQSLQSPEGLATAFVLHEVLMRPEERWRR